MIYTDSHLHTNFSSDSKEDMESMILSAINKGMQSICFTEHFDPCFPDTEDHLDFSLDFDAYESRFSSLKERYEGKIKLYHGVELGVQPHIKKECQSFVSTYGSRYDYIINSTHVVDQQDPYYGTYFHYFSSSKEAIRHYFKTMWENLQLFENYQSVGHLDYICRYVPGQPITFLYEDYQEILDEILLLLIRKDKALEINTAGWKYGMTDPNPNRQIIKRYKELGGNLITIGSDGHTTEHLAYDFHRLNDFLKALDFSSYFFYIKQKAMEIPIE